MEPRFTFNATFSTLTMTPVLPHWTRCQRNDYIFTAQLDSFATTAYNLQYVKQVGIKLPTTPAVDYAIFGRDCV